MGTYNALPRVTLNCKICDKEFSVPGSKVKEYTARGGATRQYCSIECSNKGRQIPIPTYKCEGCGIECQRRYVKPRADKPGRIYIYTQRFCSVKCARAFQKRPRGYGNGWLDKNGYRIARKDEAGVDIYEHREVMEAKLGRKLRSDETIHHKNGDRTDNRPENLELWSSRHGRGQRVSDKIDFMIGFLRDHGYGVSHFTTSEAICGIAGLVT